MNIIKSQLLLALLILTSCGNESLITSTNQGNNVDEIMSIDLLDKSNLDKILQEAISLNELIWTEDNAPAILKDSPYTGWVKQPDESLIGVGYLKDGIEDGPFLFLYENSKPKLMGSFSKGLKSGKWTAWQKDGSIQTQEIWKQGKLTKELD
jgi:antitoxin component YwqK of YwqJK toxin-antitoxin module